MNTFSNIAFIGGIHGVGKSTICQHLCHELNMEYLSASELLKWEEISSDVKNKRVKDIPTAQNRLISGLNNIIKENKNYLLDGHYCLLDDKNEIVNVPLETYKKINPFSLNIILGNIAEVKQRLESRDNKLYEYDLLKQLQNKELAHARYLSKALGITLNIGTHKDSADLLNSLRNTLAFK
ncbi:MAG TPA: ATP-binding protein [Bacteroidia bacterium]|jgi:adenylate kinase|nr:ATP-binding protein [Bacteroidia bacterium]